MVEKEERIDWKRVAREVHEVHAAVFGNGNPEKSLLARMDWSEKRIKAVIGVGITLVTGALLVLLKGVI